MKAYYVLAPLAAIAMAGCTTVYRPVAVEPAVITTPPAVAVTPAVVTPTTTVVTPPTTVLGAPPAGSVIVTPSR